MLHLTELFFSKLANIKLYITTQLPEGVSNTMYIVINEKKITYLLNDTLYWHFPNDKFHTKEF